MCGNDGLAIPNKEAAPFNVASVNGMMAKVNDTYRAFSNVVLNATVLLEEEFGAKRWCEEGRQRRGIIFVKIGEILYFHREIGETSFGTLVRVRHQSLFFA